METVSIFVDNTKHIEKDSTISINGNNLFVVDVLSDKEIKVCSPNDAKPVICEDK